MHRLWENWENRHSNHLLWGLFAPTSWMRRAEPGTFSTGVVLTFPGWWREELCRSPGPKLFPWGHPGQWLKGVAGRPTLPGCTAANHLTFPALGHCQPSVNVLLLRTQLLVLRFLLLPVGQHLELTLMLFSPNPRWGKPCLPSHCLDSRASLLFGPRSHILVAIRILSVTSITNSRPGWSCLLIACEGH